MPVCLLPFQSVCFLFIGLFPNSRSISCPSVCFQNCRFRFLSFSWSACRPVSFPLVYFQFFSLFPVHQNRFVSSSSLSFKFIDMFYINPSPAHCYLSTGRFHACLSDPVSPSVFPYLGRFMIYCPVSCLSFWILFICLPIFCPFICYVFCLLEQCVPCHATVCILVSCLSFYFGFCPLEILQITLPIFLFLVTCLLFRLSPLPVCLFAKNMMCLVSFK